MSHYEQPRNHEPQTQTSQTAAAHEHRARPAKHASLTTQAERAVMHPTFSTGPEDYGDPDWRCYYATIA